VGVEVLNEKLQPLWKWVKAAADPGQCAASARAPDRDLALITNKCTFRREMQSRRAVLATLAHADPALEKQKPSHQAPEIHSRANRALIFHIF